MLENRHVKWCMMLSMILLFGTACSRDEMPVSAGYETTTSKSSVETEARKEAAKERKIEKTIPQVLAALEWDKKAVYLPEVLESLAKAGVIYRGVYNYSGERADVTLSDGTKMMFLLTRNSEGDDQGYELMMCGDWFQEIGFQERYLNQYDVTRDEEYYPETKTQRLNPDDLVDHSMKQNQTNLSIARNEIFARHGRMFQDEFLRAVFQRKDWYQELYSGEEFSKMQSELLSKVEQDNIGIITNMERDYGYRPSDGASYQVPECIVSGSWLDLDGDGKLERITYEDGRLVCYNTVEGSPKSTRIMGKQFSTVFQHDYFQTYPTRETYELQSGSIVRIDLGWYEFGNEARVIAEIPLYKEKGGEAIGVILVPGDEVIILGTDYKGWVGIQKKHTGEMGWLKCTDETDVEASWGYACMLPDGRKVASYELFEGLIFYG